MTTLGEKLKTMIYCAQQELELLRQEKPNAPHICLEDLQKLYSLSELWTVIYELVERRQIVENEIERMKKPKSQDWERLETETWKLMRELVAADVFTRGLVNSEPFLVTQ